MSERYPGGFISKNAPTVSTSGAQGVWTIEQQAAYAKAGQWPFGGPFNYIEDVFSTYLYTGNASTQNIVNGIDLAGKGGMVWGKARNDTGRHVLFDTERGVLNEISSNLTAAQTNHAASLTAFNSNGYTLGNDDWTNYSTSFNSVSWTFRKQPKFFDVVTYTGSGATQAINHNLGSTPGCIIIKNYNPGNTDWTVYHRSLGTGAYLQLNNSNASVGSSAVSAVSSTTFTVAGGSANWNSSGQSYVAYLFAHDAGGFGPTGADNVISCGSFTAGNTSTPTVVNLGFEPQWVLIKRTTGGDPYYVEWRIFDVMRGMPNPSGALALYPNASWAESSADAKIFPTATGFSVLFDGVNISGNNFIYIAIRRGPMKTPTSGTSVFTPIARTGTGANATITSGFVTDTVITKSRAFSFVPAFYDRLRGALNYLQSSNTSAEAASTASLTGFDSNTGYTVGADGTNATINFDGGYVNYAFQRAPGFMDVVCYTGNGSVSGQTLNHNLTVAPEFIIVKARSTASNWRAYASSQGVASYAVPNSVQGFSSPDPNNPWKTPTATTFGVGDGTYWTTLNASGTTYVAYLFASCPGVSKVGSFTQVAGVDTAVNCGFTSGARFILIKSVATTSNDEWYVWDSARGITSGNEPYIRLNKPNPETTTSDSIVPNANGFTTSGSWWSAGTYIYLAIA